MAAEEQEREEYSRQNQEYISQRNNLKQKIVLIQREIDMMEVEIMKETRILEARQRTREITRNQRLTDLQLYQEKLGISITPVEANKNHVHVIFTKIDLNDPERQFKFCLDISEMMNIRPFQLDPSLPAEQLNTLLRGQTNVFKLLGQLRAFYSQNLY